MKEKIVGIIGGMGPEATVDLMMRVIRETPAEDDVDHIRMVVDNNPKTPSRIKALVEKTGESPGPCMAEMAQKLAEWGVDFLAIPCNTAHYYYEEVQSAVKIPVLNMVERTTALVIEENPAIHTVGLLATDAVLNTGVYKKRFEERGVGLIYPPPVLQAQVMDAIREIKTSRYDETVRERLRSAANALVSRKAEAVIVACTELSIIADAIETEVKVYDASQVLAENIVRMAKGCP